MICGYVAYYVSVPCSMANNQLSIVDVVVGVDVDVLHIWLCRPPSVAAPVPDVVPVKI